MKINSKSKVFSRFFVFCLICILTFGESVMAATWSCKNEANNNPIATQRFTADPGVMVYNDEVFIYTTNDILEYKNGQIAENTYSEIQTLNCYSSKDLVNWTDHGTIQVAGNNGAAKWASNSWAPCAAHKKIDGKDKFFLYFANNASSIGVLTADSPVGPWRDPIGRPIVNKSTANCWDVTWMFDPAVFVDSDGQGYLYFGGGIPENNFAHPNTARVAKLSYDMTGISGTPAKIDAPYILEDSGINKIGNKYYYSYCSNWNTSGSGITAAAIEYMVGNSPMGPFTYAGEVMKNPGSYFGSVGNNHHSIFEFKGKLYMAYHARAVESATIRKSLGYRSTQIDQLSVSNGKINLLTPTMKGVSQVGYMNPYSRVQAETMYNQGGINVTGSGDTAVSDIQNGDWTCVRGVNFANGLSKITARVKSWQNGKIEVRQNSATGTLLGTINVSNTNGSFKEFDATMNNVSGVKNIYFVFSGSFDFDSWYATTKSGSTNSQGGNTQGENNNTGNETGGNTSNVVNGTLKNGWYYIKNTNAQKYLQVTGNRGGNGINVEIGTGTGVKGQKWYVENTNDGYFTLKNGNGYMLDVQYGKNEDGTNIQTYQANGADAQRFKTVKTEKNGVVGIVTKVSSGKKSLDVYNFGTADGSNVCEWTYYGNSCQEWIFEPCQN